MRRARAFEVAVYTKSPFLMGPRVGAAKLLCVLPENCAGHTIATVGRQCSSIYAACNERRPCAAGIPKLDDANDAGTKASEDCTLILTEGDSAKALAVAGLSVVGRNRYGVFPLRYGRQLSSSCASLRWRVCMQHHGCDSPR